jgi:hypothetical protein
MKLHELKPHELKGHTVLYVVGWLEMGRLKTQKKFLKIIKATKKDIRVEGAKAKFDYNGFEKKDLAPNSPIAYIVPMTEKQILNYQKVSDLRYKLAAELQTVINKITLLTVNRKDIEVEIKTKPKHAMNIQEAKVEAALFSKLSDRVVYIVNYSKDKEEFFLSTSEDDKKSAVTFYQYGCEEGKGYRPPVLRHDEEKPKRKRTAEELIDGIGEPKKPREPKAPKQPTVLEVKEFKNVAEAAKSTESCKAKIGGKIWVVSVKGSWAIQRSVIDQCEAGLILVIRSQGYYTHDKKMWSEFESIFKSSTYDAGKPYSQSILPKKFEKYFTKFSTVAAAKQVVKEAAEKVKK